MWLTSTCNSYASSGYSGGLKLGERLNSYSDWRYVHTFIVIANLPPPEVEDRKNTNSGISNLECPQAPEQAVEDRCTGGHAEEAVKLAQLE